MHIWLEQYHKKIRWTEQCEKWLYILDIDGETEKNNNMILN